MADGDVFVFGRLMGRAIAGVNSSSLNDHPPKVI